MGAIGLIVLWLGIGLCVVGVIGLMRMPDLYCRLHASGKVSTVGLCGLLLGATLIMPSATAKLFALAIFAILTLPVSTHAIAAAAYRHGIPMRKAVRDDMANRPENVAGKNRNEELSAA
jgi:multicomponent Na+:H+ antiporter subunit G